jgi:hypothetical protein
LEQVVALLCRPIAFATAAGAAVLLAFPLTAGARERDLPGAAPLPPVAAVDHVHDAVFEGPPPGALRTANVGADTRSYLTPDGHRVEVEVSRSYPSDPVADQSLVDFLGSRLHGSELSSLSVYVGGPGEIRRLCGGHPSVIACYSIYEGRMYVPGEEVHGIPVDYPLTHEYGHHLASTRLNRPWDALDWGPKYWASAARVCTHVAAGRLFPGNQGARYRDDPGEGFADGYAHLHFPETPWYFSKLLRPRPALFRAIRRDVLHPWTGPRSRTFRGQLGPGRDTRTFRVPVRLDGNVRLRVDGPPGATYSVQAETRGFATGAELRSGRGFRVEWCRRRPVDRVAITVRRRSGVGPFALTVRWPG